MFFYGGRNMKGLYIDGDASSIVLKLSDKISVTKFSDSLFFAEAEGRFVQLDFYEQKLISDFNGRNTLADIIAFRLEQGDSSVFDKLISLIEKLNSQDLFDPECSAALKKTVIPKSRFSGKILAGKNLKITSALSLFGKIVSSVPFLILMAAVSLATFFVPSFKGINIFTSITQGTTSFSGAYILALVFIYVFLFAILSLPALFAAADLAANGIETQIELKLKFGILYLSVPSSVIIKKGKKISLKHYIMLLLVPFAVSGTTALLWRLGISRPAMAVINIIATGCGIIALSPVSNSPLAMIAGFFMPGGANTFNYIRKQFVKDLLGLKKLSVETERMIIFSSYGLVWIYFVYRYFWGVARSTMSYLFSDFYTAYNEGSTGSMILIALTLLFIILPALSALIGFITIALGNVGSVAATPLARMRDIAGGILAKQVPTNNEIIEFVKQIPLFAELEEEELKELCKHIKLRRFMKHSSIVRQGDKGENFYTIVSGTAKVVVMENNGTEKIVGMLSTGDSFGETALLEKGVRTASVVTTAPTAVFEISREGFEKFLASSSESREKLTGKIRLGKMLLASPVFSFMSQQQTAFLIKNLKSERVKQDSVIFRQGDEGDRFYFIQEGSIHLERVDNSVKTLDIILKPGNFFGEMALVRNIPRTATAEAVTDSLLYSLDKESFRTIIGNTLFGGKELDSLINKRALQLGKEVLESCLRK